MVVIYSLIILALLVPLALELGKRRANDGETTAVVSESA